MSAEMKRIKSALYVKANLLILNMLYSFRRMLLSMNPNITIGKGTSIETDSRLLVVDKWGYGNIRIGDDSYIGHGVQIIPAGKGVIIGSNSTINSYTVIYGQGGKNR